MKRLSDSEVEVMTAVWKLTEEKGDGALMVELKEELGIPQSQRGLHAVLLRLEEKGYVHRREPSMSRLPSDWKLLNRNLAARKRSPPMLLLEPLVSEHEAAQIEAEYVVERLKGQMEFCRVVGERLTEVVDGQGD